MAHNSNASRRSSYATAASRIGITLVEYEAHRAQGERWCSRCKQWHPEAAFSADSARGFQRVCRKGPWRNRS